MELSPPDQLKLNVLLANRLQAVRIDESRLIVYALTDKGEMRVELTPNARDERYLRSVRELFASHVLDSPEGHPVYLRRWYRMGQTRNDNLDKLLLLGEPEAVVAVAHAPGLTEILARRAWWAMPDSANACAMLSHGQIANSALGPELAKFIVEYLPFEADPATIAQSVRLVLQPNLIEPALRTELWQKSRAKSAYALGFLLAQPDELPDPLPCLPDDERLVAQLADIATHPVARLLLRVSASSGQTFLYHAQRVLKKAGNQDMVNGLFACLAEYFAPLHSTQAQMDMPQLLISSRQWLASSPPEVEVLLARLPASRAAIEAMWVFAHLGYPVLRPVFSRTDAIGSLMRKKLAPITTSLDLCFQTLRQPFTIP